MFINMKLKNEPFNKIEERTKTIELRLLDDKRREIKAGDYIKFKNLSSNEIIITKVQELIFADTFEKLFSMIDDNVSMGFSEKMSTEEMCKTMEQYYSKEEQGQFGVVGIRIKVLFAPADIIKIAKKAHEGNESPEFEFYLMHDAVEDAYKKYMYSRQEFGEALAYLAAALLEVGSATGYDIFDEIEKAYKRHKEDDELNTIN